MTTSRPISPDEPTANDWYMVGLVILDPDGEPVVERRIGVTAETVRTVEIDTLAQLIHSVLPAHGMRERKDAEAVQRRESERRQLRTAETTDA